MTETTNPLTPERIADALEEWQEIVDEGAQWANADESIKKGYLTAKTIQAALAFTEKNKGIEKGLMETIESQKQTHDALIKKLRDAGA